MAPPAKLPLVPAVDPLPAYRFEDAEREIRKTLKRIAKKTDGKAGGLKHAAAAIGFTYQNFVRHLKRSEELQKNGKTTRRRFLDVEELGRLAAYVGEHLGEPAPPGWPIYTFAAREHDLHTARSLINAARH